MAVKIHDRGHTYKPAFHDNGFGALPADVQAASLPSRKGKISPRLKKMSATDVGVANHTQLDAKGEHHERGEHEVLPVTTLNGGSKGERRNQVK